MATCRQAAPSAAILARLLGRRWSRAASLALVLLLGAACYTVRPTVLGPGGQSIERVPRGTVVEIQFAAPRRLVGRSAAETRRLPPTVSRLRGTVQRASTDTLFVAVSDAAAPAKRLHPLSRAVVAPVVINRDVAVRERRMDVRRTALVGAGVLAVLVAIVAATR